MDERQQGFIADGGVHDSRRLVAGVEDDDTVGHQSDLIRVAGCEDHSSTGFRGVTAKKFVNFAARSDVHALCWLVEQKDAGLVDLGQPSVYGGSRDASSEIRHSGKPATALALEDIPVIR